MRKNEKKNLLKKSLYALPAAGIVGLFAFGSMPKHIQFTGHFSRDLQNAAQQTMSLNLSQAVQGNVTANLTNGIRQAIGMIMGYGSRTAYVSMICQNGVDPGNNASCDGPPQAGIVGTIATFVNQLPSAAKSAGISSCDAVPSSGTYTGTDSDGGSITMKFSSPTKSIPAPWVNGGTSFTHRVTFSSLVSNIGPTPTSIAVAYEFICNSSASYTAISMDAALTNGGAFANNVRDIAIFNGPVTSTLNGLEVYLMEHQASSNVKVRTADVVRIYHDDTAKTFSLWGLIDSNLGALQNLAMQKVFASGNYSTGQALIYDHAVVVLPNADASLDSSMAGVAVGGTDATLDVTVTGHDFSSDLTGGGASATTVAAAVLGTPTVLDNYGCINFTTPNVDAAHSDAACAALSKPVAPTGAPFLAPAGEWNLSTLLALGAAVEHVTGY